MAARISFADLSDATGISPDLLEAEVHAIQRASFLGDPPAEAGPAPSIAADAPDETPPSSRRPPPSRPPPTGDRDRGARKAAA